MGERCKYIILGVGYFLGIINGLLLLYYEKIGYMMSLIIIFLAFGMAITTKLILNSYIDEKKYKWINLLIMNHIMKILILIFCLYFNNTNRQQVNLGLETTRYILDFNVLDLLAMVLIYYILEDRERRLYKMTIIVPLLLLVGGVCSFIPSQYVGPICDVLSVMSFIIGGYVYFRWKCWRIKYFKDGLYGYKSYLLLSIIQFFIVHSTMDIIEPYQFAISTVVMIQAMYLFVSLYNSFLVIPWKKKIDALEEAENMIHKQGKECDLIVGLSHELKTPVNVIRSALDMLAIECVEKQGIIDEVEDIKRECIDMMNMIQNMIDIQKMKGHHIEAKNRVYNLVEVIENVVDAFSSEMVSSPFVFNPKEEEIYQEVDIGLIQQGFMLLFNLLMVEDLKSELYIEVGRNQVIMQELDKKETIENRIYVMIRHSKMGNLKEIASQAKENTLSRNNIRKGLELQVIELIFKMNQILFQYEMKEENTIKMVFPYCELVTNEWVDEGNIMLLREQIKARGLVRNL